VVTYGFANIDDFSRFLVTFWQKLSGNWRKFVVFGYFLSTLISRLKKGSKSQGEKSEDLKKIFRKLKILNPKLETISKPECSNDQRNEGESRMTQIFTDYQWHSPKGKEGHIAARDMRGQEERREILVAISGFLCGLG